MAEWDQFLEVFSEALEVEPEDISSGTKLEDIEEWDSIGALSLIAEVDEVFDVVLKPDALEACVFVGDIFNIVKAG